MTNPIGVDVQIQCECPCCGESFTDMEDAAYVAEMTDDDKVYLCDECGTGHYRENGENA